MEISSHGCTLIKKETDCSLFEDGYEGCAFGWGLLEIFVCFGCIFECIVAFLLGYAKLRISGVVFVGLEILMENVKAILAFISMQILT